MTLEELSKIALIGTSRSSGPLPAAGDAVLQQAIDSTGTKSAEEKILSAAAFAGAYETCGRIGQLHAAVVAPAPSDVMPECSPVAGELLNQILSMSSTPAKGSLLQEWLAAAARAKRRPPHVLLAPLLEYAAGNRRVREAVVPVIDQRGHWLMGLNPKWQFAAPEDADVATVFATGNKDQRLAAIRRCREADAKQARELIQSTWQQDAAEERAAFVSALSTGLSGEDEPFLEAALDDRSKQVRAAAAELLSRIDGSAYVRRMVERVEPLLVFTPGTAGGLLKRGKPPRVEAKLPPDAFDPSWLRDGIIEKSPDAAGRRQGWLSQMLRAIPPSHWSAQWALTPKGCFEAASSDFAGLMVTAWSESAELHRDVAWMQAAVLKSLEDVTQPVRISVIPRLPPADQRVVLEEVLTSSRLDGQVLGRLLSELKTPFDAKLSEKAIAAVERVRDKTQRGYDYTLPGLLDPLSHLLWPGVGDGLAGRWSGEAWESNRKALDSFFQTLQMRRHIQTEFGL